MELCVEGSLEALVATAGALAEATARRYAKQLLSAVAALHARNIAHRDIKSTTALTHVSTELRGGTLTLI